jgi:polyribonucleotide nucleotidyltransferase
MITDLTATPDIGKTYLGKVVRLAEFGAFVEIFPGTDGLLHVSEIAEHRVKEVKDELREGDQILVKVLAIEGNRIKLSRKAVLREQREKLGLPPAPDPNAHGGRVPQPPAVAPAPGNIAEDDEFDDDDEDGDEGGDEEGEDEPNFNRADNVPVPVAGQPVGGNPGGGQPRPAGGREGGGPGGNRRPGGRRRRGGRRPGQGGGTPGGGRPPQA